jgi:hypothetical protein
MIYLPIYLPSNNRWRRPDVVPSASKHNYRVKVTSTPLWKTVELTAGLHAEQMRHNKSVQITF